MLEILQGALGSGKSAAATARALDHIRKGGVVAANFSLVDGWAEIVASQNIFCKYNKQLHYDRACSLHSRFFRVNSLSAIRKIEPKALAVDSWKFNPKKYREGYGLLILDECQLIFNSRKWEKNMDWIQFFTQSRKLGWDVLLIAHTIDMVDSQIRPLFEYETRFRNLQKVYFPFTPIPVSPFFPLFLTIKRYAGLGAGSGNIADRTVYPLPKWAAELYDTALVFDQESWGRDTEPELCGLAPAPPLCGGVGATVKAECYLSGFFDDCAQQFGLSTKPQF